MTPIDPADGTPSVRVAQAEPGEPSLDAPDTGEGGKTSPPAAPAPGSKAGTSSSSLPLSPGEADVAAARAKTPAGGVGASPASSAGLQGAEWRKKVKAATSALHAAQRRGAHRYTKVADRTAGSQYKPGMAVRKPPEKPGGVS